MACFRMFPALLLILVVIFCTAPQLCNGAKSNNCKGSFRCGENTQDECRRAVARYDDNAEYSRYTSRVSGHCTAIFRCDGTYPRLKGSALKPLFLNVYNSQPCKICGSHAFDGGNCEATLNFCSSCNDVN